MIIPEVSDRRVGAFWCSDCNEVKNTEFWSVCYGDAHFGNLCRGCISAMVNRLLAKLCPGDEVQRTQAEHGATDSLLLKGQGPASPYWPDGWVTDGD